MAEVTALLLGLAPIAAVIWPGTGKLAVLLVAASIVAALHGLGRLVGAIAGDDDAPVGLAIVWGLAAYLGVAGLLIMVGQSGPAAQVGIIAGGCVLGAGWLWRRAARAVEAPRPSAATVAVTILALAVVAIVVLATAGRWSGPFTDAETSYLGQLQRLHDTGGLADGFGFPRAAGLGGQLAIAALASPLDPRSCLLVDRGVMFAIVILLALGQVRTRRPMLVVAFALPIAMTAVPEYLVHMAPLWSVVALVVGTAASFDRALARRSNRAMLLVVLTAAAAATIEHSGLAFAVVAIVAAGRAIGRRDRAPARWWRQAAAIGVAVIAPFAVALVRARAAVPAFDVSRAAPGVVGALVAAGLVLAIIAGVALPRGSGTRTTLLAACAGVAATGLLAPSAAAAWQLALPLALAILLVVVLGVTTDVSPPDDGDGPRPIPFGATVVALTAVLGVISLARFATARPLSWRVRVIQLIDDARAVGRLPAGQDTRLAAAYAAAQRVVPDGARLGIWVERAELIRYDRHAVIDLRSGVVRGLDATLPALRLDYVVVDAAARSGPVDAFARRGVTIHQAGGLSVIDVRGRR